MMGAEAVALRATKEYQAAESTRAHFLRGIADMRGRHSQNRTGHINIGRRRPFREAMGRPIIITTSS